MTAFIVAVVLVPLIDQAVKSAVLRRLRAQPISLGPLGEVRAVTTQIWMLRGRRGTALMWTAWIVSAAALTLMSWAAPSVGLLAGLLLGASLSHAIETSHRGQICDYVCLHFWPAFNLADVALTIGACGVALQLLILVRGAW